MDPESFNRIHTAAVRVRLPNFKSSFLCVLCLFAAISGFSLSFASLREIFVFFRPITNHLSPFTFHPFDALNACLYRACRDAQGRPLTSPSSHSCLLMRAD